MYSKKNLDYFPDFGKNGVIITETQILILRIIFFLRTVPLLPCSVIQSEGS